MVLKRAEEDLVPVTSNRGLAREEQNTKWRQRFNPNAYTATSGSEVEGSVFTNMRGLFSNSFCWAVSSVSCSYSARNDSKELSWRTNAVLSPRTFGTIERVYLVLKGYPESSFLVCSEQVRDRCARDCHASSHRNQAME